MIIFLFFIFIPCFSMQTSIKFCAEINNKMQQNIVGILKKLPRKIQGSAVKIYIELGSELTTRLVCKEHQEIETILNGLYTNIFKDLISIYLIKSALKEVSYDELKQDGKKLLTTEMQKQTAICFPEGEPDETNFYYMKNFLSQNNDLLLPNCKTALYYAPYEFSLFSNNESRDLKLTIFAFSYLDQLLEKVLTSVKQRKYCQQLFCAPALSLETI